MTAEPIYIKTINGWAITKLREGEYRATARNGMFYTFPTYKRAVSFCYCV